MRSISFNGRSPSPPRYRQSAPQSTKVTASQAQLNRAADTAEKEAQHKRVLLASEGGNRDVYTGKGYGQKDYWPNWNAQAKGY